MFRSEKISILFLLFTVFFSGIFAQTPVLLKTLPDNNAKFFHLKPGEGIAQNSIPHIAQDSTGQMWFATKDGVVRYDAKDYYYYKHDADNSHSLGGNFVERIFVDAGGNVWVGTEPAVLNLYHPETDDFTVELVLEGQRIKDIAQDANGLLWITTNRYLYRFHPDNHQLKRFVYKEDVGIDRLLITGKGRFFITTNEIFVLEFFPQTGLFKEIYLLHPHEAQSTRSTATYSAFLMTEDHTGNIWFSTHGGFLVNYNPDTGEQQRYIFAKTWLEDNAKLTVMFVMEDKAKNLWLGTWFNGLFRILPDRKSLYQYLPDKKRKESISNSIIHSGFQDKAGNLWFGTEFAGINILKNTDKFSVIAHRSDDKYSLPSYEYSFAVGDYNDTLWVGTLGDGLYTAKNKQNNIKFIKHKILPEEFWINNIWIEESDEIWLGIGNKLVKYTPLNGKQRIFTHSRNDYNSLTPGIITTIYKDKENIWWIGTTGGLTRFDENKHKFVRFVHEKDNPRSLSHNLVTAIVSDANNDIWVGTINGLNKLNKQSGNFTIFKQDYNSNSISGNRINDLYAEGKNLWIASFEGGLNCYNLNDKSFKVYNKEEGLPDNNIKAIESDSNGNLWFSSKKNIVKFVQETGQFIYYDASDGLSNKMYVENMGWQDLEFSSGFSYKDYKGYLYFGGVSGIVRFHPDSLRLNNYKPPVLLKAFFVNGKKKVFSNQKINLKNKENHLKFELAVLNYIQPEKNRFAYKLEGYDTNWQYGGINTTIEYFNLPPGKYIFTYKGCNNDGVWSDIYKTPVIIIARPFYRTAGFYSLQIILLIVLVAVFVIYRIYLKRKLIRQKKKLRYKSSNLKEEDALRISNKLEEKLKREKLYLEPDLSLHKLAESIDEKPHHVSQVINQLYDKRFGDYINTFRVEEAKKLLVETYLKIEAVAYDSGFSSLSTFNAVFKKETGLTPSKYRKTYRKDE